MSWTISTDPARLRFDTVHAWLRTCYWSPNIRRDVCEHAFANSLVAGAYADDGTQLGVARVATDRATFAWLCDVYVAEPARGQGIARALSSALLAHPELQTLRRWVLATRDAHEVYRPLGFAAPPDGVFMAIAHGPERWADAP